MLNPNDLVKISNQSHISQAVILREYCQVVMVISMTTHSLAHHFYFKGGTAIRLLLDGNRFSEDLDFTVIDLEPDAAGQAIEAMIGSIQDVGTRSSKPLTTLAGKSYRLTWQTPLLSTPITIKIDLSFRESVLEPMTSVIRTNYPVIATNYVQYLSKNELVAEKVRALLHRTKGRDLYDLWFLLSIQAEFNPDLINRKLSYYQETFNPSQLKDKITTFPKDKFITDISPFVGKPDRDHLPILYDVIQSYLKNLPLS